MLTALSTRHLFIIPLALCVALSGASLLTASDAKAQALVAIVNGSPVTNIDVDHRMKLLRALGKPAGRENAIESIAEDRLKIEEVKKYGISPQDSMVGEEATRVAMARNQQPSVFLGNLRRAGIDEAHLKQYFGSQAVFRMYVRARNKALEPSEAQVRAEIAKQGGKGSASEYRVREIVFTVPGNASAALLQQRSREAEALRARFSDCETGLGLARGLTDVAIKPEMTRTSVQLSEPLRALLDKTQIGRLTPPSRDPNGIAVIALCQRGSATDDSSLREQIGNKLLDAKLIGESERLYKEVRDRAVIEKR